MGKFPIIIVWLFKITKFQTYTIHCLQEASMTMVRPQETDFHTEWPLKSVAIFHLRIHFYHCYHTNCENHLFFPIKMNH